MRRRKNCHRIVAEAIVADPDYADAFASLALIYANAYRFDLGQGTVPFDPLPRALELARRAVDLATDSTHSYQALHLVYWLMNDVERSLEAAERGLALNPNDTELMADLGLRYCMRAQWDKGLPLVRQAYARNPAQSGQYRIAPFLHHYVNGRYEEALAEAKRVEAHGIIYNHIALAVAYAELGQTVEADAEVRQILAVDPAYADHVRGPGNAEPAPRLDSRGRRGPHEVRPVDRRQPDAPSLLTSQERGPARPLYEAGFAVLQRRPGPRPCRERCRSLCDTAPHVIYRYVLPS